MSLTTLSPSELTVRIDPDALGFDDTSALVAEPLPWIGQERAETAARFGLGVDAPDYHLFVLGEVGSGRATLMHQLMREVAASRPVPPDLCYLHNFDAPERPRALRMPPGQGRELRQHIAQLARALQTEVPQRLGESDFKAERERIEQTYKAEEAKAFDELNAYAEARSFRVYRESGRLVFTLVDAQGEPMTEAAAVALPRERRAEIERTEQDLREQISRFLDRMRPMQRVMHEALAALRRQTIKPWLDHELQEIRLALKKQIKDSVKLGAYLDQIGHDILENLEVFEPTEEEEEARQEALIDVLSRYRVNLVVDNGELQGAPVVVDDNPVLRSLFGSVEYQSENDVLVTDFSRIRAGSLHRAHGGFLLLHLRDLLADEFAWEKLRRFLRSGRLRIEEPGTTFSLLAAVTLEPEPVDIEARLVLIGSAEQFYTLQEADPEFARHFRVKVDFADAIPATPATRHGTAVLVAHTCRRLGLPHLSAAAVAGLIEAAQREVDDQTRQSAIFARTETLVIEAAAHAGLRGSRRVEREDVDAALAGRTHRHNGPEQRLREAIAEGERIVSVRGEHVGLVNGLSQVDLGDHRFGLPVRVTARTHAGHEGVLNIEREVELSGPIHDKGVLILQGYLHALFAHLAPLALQASLVFEQEYGGIEGDSASCAEFFALLSALSGLGVRQGLAVTGALSQHGDVLPVGGLNEKIEGWFRTCEAAGLDGTQGVVIPARNRRHLVLDARVQAAVAQGRFQVHTMERALDAVPLLLGQPTGLPEGEAPAGATPGGTAVPGLSPGWPPDSVLGRAEATLRAYRRACLPGRSRRRPRA